MIDKSFLLFFPLICCNFDTFVEIVVNTSVIFALTLYFFEVFDKSAEWGNQKTCLNSFLFSFFVNNVLLANNFKKRLFLIQVSNFIVFFHVFLDTHLILTLTDAFLVDVFVQYYFQYFIGSIIVQSNNSFSLPIISAYSTVLQDHEFFQNIEISCYSESNIYNQF